jgi:hypothetical protein
LQLVAATGSPQAFEGDYCSLPEVEDEDLVPEVLLHVAYEVVTQLDRAEEFRLLSLEEQSLRNFLVEQICSLQLVIEAQDGSTPSLAQEAIASAQDSWPNQETIDIASFDCCPVAAS